MAFIDCFVVVVVFFCWLFAFVNERFKIRLKPLTLFGAHNVYKRSHCGMLLWHSYVSCSICSYRLGGWQVGERSVEAFGMAYGLASI